ncbi:MAG: lamin tail domain-containing protein [Bacteroidetes bacterium]|nr:lamin tail domain-containing protein [Bacteroidota bacterium]
MKITYYLLGVAWLCMHSLRCHAQVSESFSDGNYSQNPQWIVSNTEDWIVNASSQLQSNCRQTNSDFWIATEQQLSDSVQWEMDIRFAFNPSSANYADIYLMASVANPNDSACTGYFIRVGNTNDEIALYRRDRMQKITKLIEGVKGLLNKSDNTFRLKVTRRKTKGWELFYDPTLTGENYIAGGSAADTTYRESRFFTLLIKQSTASFFQKHFFDDVRIKPFSIDTLPPQVVYTPKPGDIVINEILFDPPSFGKDYIELYNRSGFPISLQNFKLANRDYFGNITNLTPLLKEPYRMQPEEYLVFTQDTQYILHAFPVRNPAALRRSSSLPSMPNDKGTIVLLDGEGKEMDALAYESSWHFPLIKNTEGVSLERIHPDKPNVADNWMSAAQSSAYGTPGKPNSQHNASRPQKENITLSATIFSPDQDGVEDLLWIHYQFPEGGYVMNIQIFDVAGQRVRILQRNSVGGISGSFRWDGLDEQQQPLPMGHYLIVTEAFNLQGKKKRFLNTVVLARRN